MHPEASDVIGLVRLYCWRQGAHWIEDYPTAEAPKHRTRLTREGVTVYHTEFV